jgi:hypothetical protein
MFQFPSQIEHLRTQPQNVVGKKICLEFTSDNPAHVNPPAAPALPPSPSPSSTHIPTRLLRLGAQLHQPVGGCVDGPAPIDGDHAQGEIRTAAIQPGSANAGSTARRITPTK